MAAESNELVGLRVDQVGSLIRPEGLREAVARYRDGDANDDELRPRRTRPFAR